MPRIAYISFDDLSVPKGASTHIQAFARGLAREFGGVDLVTPGPSCAGVSEESDGVRHWRFPAVGRSLIDRVLTFREFLTRWLKEREFDAIQFRSVFEGTVIAHYRKGAALIFEVNGLPSIELKYRYPGCEDDRILMGKLLAQERALAAAADWIVTPSEVTRGFLVSQRGARGERVTVIRNGVDLEAFRARPLREAAGMWRALYFGTLAPWQGVDLAVRAVAQLEGVELRAIGSGTRARKHALIGLAEKLGCGTRFGVVPPMGQTELAEELANCDVVLAPLTWNDRNAVQGCCPLKVLEGMAAARPVITSNLAVTRELGEDGCEFLLTRPGSVDELAGAITRLRADRELAASLAARARNAVERRFTWEKSCAELNRGLRGLLRGARVPVGT